MNRRLKLCYIKVTCFLIILFSLCLIIAAGGMKAIQRNKTGNLQLKNTLECEDFCTTGTSYCNIAAHILHSLIFETNKFANI